MVIANRSTEHRNSEIAGRSIEREPGEGVVLINGRIEPSKPRGISAMTWLDIKRCVRTFDVSALLNEHRGNRLKLLQPCRADIAGQVQIPVAFVRGSIDIDGCRCRHRRIVGTRNWGGRRSGRTDASMVTS